MFTNMQPGVICSSTWETPAPRSNTVYVYVYWYIYTVYEGAYRDNCELVLLGELQHIFQTIPNVTSLQWYWLMKAQLAGSKKQKKFAQCSAALCSTFFLALLGAKIAPARRGKN